MEYPAEHAEILGCPHAVLPALIFGALGGDDALGPHGYHRSYGECVRGLAAALKRLRDLVALEAPAGLPQQSSGGPRR